MEEEIEIWKPAVGFEGFYEVSNLSNIRSVQRNYTTKSHKIIPRQLKLSLTKRGYLKVMLCCEGIKFTKFAHRISATTFIPNPDNKSQVNHINGIRNDNRIENLEWCTEIENKYHAKSTGLLKYLGTQHYLSI